MKNSDEDGATAAEKMAKNLNIPPHTPSSISFFFLFFFPLVEEEENGIQIGGQIKTHNMDN